MTRERGIAKFQHGGGNGFRKALGNRTPGGRLEMGLVPPRRLGCHLPVTRRRAGEPWRTENNISVLAVAAAQEPHFERAKLAARVAAAAGWVPHDGASRSLLV